MRDLLPPALEGRYARVFVRGSSIRMRPHDVMAGFALLDAVILGADFDPCRAGIVYDVACPSLPRIECGVVLHEYNLTLTVCTGAGLAETLEGAQFTEPS